MHIERLISHLPESKKLLENSLRPQ
ncbi:hypothetical protein SAM23877_6475 [Streptomyces ambofaciens ATCC 23877]|uniref:Uncharacterized protein n=1 Tax=Streptomyces ambofaciens (strain ATCC 23877 / 3486 / DSM 40053 / JCM 4204 / NBRC 12836 / NRRL B-2516) TaxID=278992 RepID=A0A0K2B2D9_STRA7|nr:hypothetical protein SAM23877_6475 [Streptomyces ambofaciens ATCC 23877]